MKRAFNVVAATVAAALLLAPTGTSAQQTTTAPAPPPPGVSRTVDPGLGLGPNEPTTDTSFKSHDPPAYPREALAAKIEGTTVLLVAINAEGLPFSIVVEHSSGNRALDEAAVGAARRWTFNPRRKDGVAVGDIARVPVAFQIGNRTIPPVRVNPDWVSEISYVDPVQLATLERAAEAGDADAQTRFGSLLLSGLGVPRDAPKAMEWYGKAAAQGHPVAAYVLGTKLVLGDGVPKDPVKGIEWLQKAAVHGLSTAEYTLGWIYANGAGVPRDVPKAIAWYEKASAHGNAMADNNLGWLLAHGDGAPKDAARAVEWYRKAAARGNVLAYGNLGWMYEHGEGVQPDDVLAYAWLMVAANEGLDALAAASGNDPETRDMPALERKMTPGQLAEAKRLASSWVKGQLLSHDTK